MGENLQKEISVQIGTYRLRDKITRKFLPCLPIMKILPTKTAEILADKIATILLECFNEYESRIVLPSHCVALSHEVPLVLPNDCVTLSHKNDNSRLVLPCHCDALTHDKARLVLPSDCDTLTHKPPP